MRVLQVGSGITPQTGGGELYMGLLSKALSRKHDVYAFYPTYTTKFSKQLNIKKVDNFISYELELPIWYYWRSLKINKTWTFRLVEEVFKEVLNEVDPDIIHFHGIWRLKSAKLIEISKKLNIPSVITLHAYWFMCPLGSLLDYSGHICSGPMPEKCRICWSESISRKISETFTYFPNFSKLLAKNVLLLLNSEKDFEDRTTYLKKLLIQDVDKIIAPSNFLRKIFVQYGIPSEKIVVSENGYPLEVFKGFKKKQKECDKIVFGYVGGISWHKGVHTLVDAFLEVPASKAELRIYGNYDPTSKYVRMILSRANQKENIKFMGRFDNVTEPYSEIDVLVFPSIWYENCPLVLLEAKATKTPVLASNVGAIPEFVRDGYDGLLFRVGDSRDLLQKILYIIKNPDMVEILRQNIIPPKDINDQAREIEGIYRDIIKGVLG